MKLKVGGLENTIGPWGSCLWIPKNPLIQEVASLSGLEGPGLSQ